MKGERETMILAFSIARTALAVGAFLLVFFVLRSPRPVCEIYSTSSANSSIEAASVGGLHLDLYQAAGWPPQHALDMRVEDLRLTMALVAMLSVLFALLLLFVRSSQLAASQAYRRLDHAGVHRVAPSDRGKRLAHPVKQP